jgi:hypothetical protein
MATKYTIDDKLAITFDVNGAAVFQPAWPDGTPFASKKEAEDWAKVFIGYLKDETALQPGNSPDNPVLRDEDLVDYAALEEFERATAEQQALADELAAAAALEVELELPNLDGEPESDEDIVDAEVVTDEVVDEK